MIDGIQSNVQALNALGVSMSVTANNVANVNTDGFKASRTGLVDGPGGQGVDIGAIRADGAEGPPVSRTVTLESADGKLDVRHETTRGSTTDIGREMVHMVVDANAYAANAAVVRVHDDTAGTILDMMA